MFINGQFIDKNTVSTIRTQKNGSVILTIYFEYRVLHKKEYKTFAAAKAQETRLLRHYKLV